MRYEDILNAITSLIHKRTKAEVTSDDINEFEPGSYFIDLVDYKITFNSKHRQFKAISIDILYLPKKKENLEIMNALEDINNIFEVEGKRILKVLDRFLTIGDADLKTVDHIGHYLFDLSLYDMYGKPYDYELMKDLELKFEEVKK